MELRTCGKVCSIFSTCGRFCLFQIFGSYTLFLSNKNDVIMSLAHSEQVVSFHFVTV